MFGKTASFIMALLWNLFELLFYFVLNLPYPAPQKFNEIEAQADVDRYIDRQISGLFKISMSVK